MKNGKWGRNGYEEEQQTEEEKEAAETSPANTDQ